MSMLPPFKQQRFSYRNCNRRLNIWTGPVRSGKTVSSINSWIKCIHTAPPGDLLMTGKTNGTLYRNIVRPMQELIGSDMQYRQLNDGRVVNLWGREIHCIGANDERAEQKIRGSTIAGSYGDEITLWPESYFSMMLSRLSVKGAKFLGTTNTDNPNHYLKTGYLDRRNELDCNIFFWPIEANIYLPPEFIEALKKEYTGLWYKRFILGEWCVAEGAIYDFFDEALHRLTVTPPHRYQVVSVDYGTNNPTSFGLYGVNPYGTPKIWRTRGYYYDSKLKGKQKTDSEYADDFVKWLGGAKPRKIFVDPSAASFKAELRKRKFTGLVDIENAKNDVIEGIRVQSAMLKSGKYAIGPDSSNDECVREYYGYVWDTNNAKRGIDAPLKVDDHTKDEERYALYSLFGKKTLDYSILTRA